jgi:hypothetical protein
VHTRTQVTKTPHLLKLRRHPTHSRSGIKYRIILFRFIGHNNITKDSQFSVLLLLLLYFRILVAAAAVVVALVVAVAYILA